MSAPIIARNYAETLFALGQKHGGTQTVEEFGGALAEVAALLEAEPRVREFLETPRVSTEEKKRALRTSLEGRVPELLMRFLLVVVDKRRQGLIREIAHAYRDLVDEAFGRVRAEIAVAREPDAALRERIVASLERRLGKTVLPTFRVEPRLLGGARIRVGDQILDGSVRHQMQGLRRRLLRVPLPHAAG